MYSVRQNLIEKPAFNKVHSIIDIDEGEDFLNYLTCLGLVGESKILVLSMSRHYSFDYNDLKDLRVLVMLKKLERIRHLESFIQIVYRVLPPKGYFIGCFSISKTPEDIGFPLNYTSTNLNKFIDHFESKAYPHLYKNNLSRIFQSYGFKIFNMTEINKQGYFATQKNVISVYPA